MKKNTAQSEPLKSPTPPHPESGDRKIKWTWIYRNKEKLGALALVIHPIREAGILNNYASRT